MLIHAHFDNKNTFSRVLSEGYLWDNSRSSIQLCSTEVTPSAKLSRSLSDRSLRVKGTCGICKPSRNETPSARGEIGASTANRNILGRSAAPSLFLLSESVALSSGIPCYHSADVQTTTIPVNSKAFVMQRLSFITHFTGHHHHVNKHHARVGSKEQHK